jgi:hypothetical protein
MPPGKKKLDPAEVALIGRWIDQGARAAGPEPQALAAGFQLTPAERTYWAFQPVRRPAAPPVHAAHLVRTPIDAFLLARLEALGLGFAPEADRRTLIRRATFDLLGLPPTPEEVAAFVADDRPDAYEHLLDRLLASPHYGERWGRHWLDTAGYADSDGATSDDLVRPYAYKYRDYVIRSTNADKPFDRFIQEQLAGDELIGRPLTNLAPQEVEELVATGFLRMAPDGTGSRQAEQGLARNQVIVDTLKIVSTTLLGLTVGCAQCHNHRYDPIPQSDYYRLRAVFEPAYDWKNWRTPAQRVVSLYTDADRARARQVEVEAGKVDQERRTKQQEYIDRTFDKEVAKLPAELRDAARKARGTSPSQRTPDQQKLMREYPSLNVTAGSLYLYDQKAADDLKACADRAAKVRSAKPPEDFVAALTEVPGKVPTTYLFNRGDHEQPKQAVEPGGLTVLEAVDPLRLAPPDPKQPTTGRRLALARWLTDGEHPLTARVLVNRVWALHFGKGIVGTPGDFGFLGERPTHPELLDWLARRFTDGGWRLKALHKLIMTSTAYRQSSLREPDKDRIDPDNHLLGRMPIRRLEAEELRDALLAVSGRLNDKPFGPPVPVTVDEAGQVILGVDVRDGAGRPRGKVASLNGEESRRSVYVQVRRSLPLNLFEAFDAPAMAPNCDLRKASTVAPQALMLMNNQDVVALAEAFAARVRREVGEEPRAQVRRAWTLAFGAEPHEEEIQEAVRFLTAPLAASGTSQANAKRQAALAVFCQALLGSNPFLYVD